MSLDQIVGTMVGLKRRLRVVNAQLDGLDNRVEALNVMQAALHEMAILHDLLPKPLRDKSWALLSLERARMDWAGDRSAVK